MAQSGEGKPRVVDVVHEAVAAPAELGAAVKLFRSEGVKPMLSEPTCWGVLLGFGNAPFESASLGEVA